MDAKSSRVVGRIAAARCNGASAAAAGTESNAPTKNLAASSPVAPASCWWSTASRLGALAEYGDATASDANAAATVHVTATKNRNRRANRREHAANGAVAAETSAVAAPAAKPIVASPTTSPKGHGSLLAMPTFSEMNERDGGRRRGESDGGGDERERRQGNAPRRGGAAAAAETPAHGGVKVPGRRARDARDGGGRGRDEREPSRRPRGSFPRVARTYGRYVAMTATGTHNANANPVSEPRQRFPRRRRATRAHRGREHGAPRSRPPS